MTDAIQSAAPELAGTSVVSTGSNNSTEVSAPQIVGDVGGKSVSDVIRDKIEAGEKAAAKVADPVAAAAKAAAGATPTDPTAVVPPAYAPNFKYKVAGQEKELDKFWHGLIKDAESEKKVKEIHSKVDAFDFMKERKEHFEKQYGTLNADYESIAGTVDRFDKSVQSGDLSSAFRIANIPKEAVYKWVAQQLKYDELPAEQRAQMEAAEGAKLQRFDYEDKISRMERDYQTQAVQTRTMQLDMALMKPEVSSFAQTWDQNAEPGYSFKDTVAAEARRVYYESGKDLSPEQAVAMVMSRFGRFVSAGETAPAQSPQAASQNVITQRTAPPVIPNVAGKAASPIKKAFKSLDELRAHEKSMNG